ncbi:hypothetical protein AAG906_030716 [Vitis piasezkii]
MRAQRHNRLWRIRRPTMEEKRGGKWEKGLRGGENRREEREKMGKRAERGREQEGRDGEKRENGLRREENKRGDGGNDPYIYNTNNFVGRQIWEFDADYGTPEERAKFAKENPCVVNLPQIKVQDLKEVTEEVVTTTLRRDGGWGLHIEGPSTMFGTMLSYVTLRLLGAKMDLGPWGCNYNNFLGENVVLGAYEWSGNNPLPLEVWLCPYILLVHPDFMLTITGMSKKIKEYLHCEVIFPMS